MRFWPIAIAVAAADCTTKRAAVDVLSPPYVPHEVLGDVVRFTLAYNTGIAFGLPAGGARWLLAAVALAVVIGVWHASQQAPSQVWRTVALALLAGGAIGNAIDRVRWTQGVVDFVDIGVGATRFWTFNVADAALTCGAVILLFVGLQHRPQVSSDVK